MHWLVSNWQLFPQLSIPSVKWPMSSHPVIAPQTEPSHCSPESITLSPQVPPRPPKQLAVSNLQSGAHTSVPPPNLSKSVQSLMLPQEEMSHCSPASTMASPQFPPERETQVLVSNWQSALHTSMPPTKLKSVQPETPSVLRPSHCSPLLMTPSPHATGVSDGHPDVLSMHLSQGRSSL